MSTAVVEPSPPPAKRFGLGPSWPLVLGYIALALPTAYRLATQSWNSESGAHGPIILATGGWLIWRELGEIRRDARPGHWAITTLILVPSLVLYVFGSAYDFLTFEAAGLYGAGLAIMHAVVGWRAMVKQWFPLLYFAFAVPPPSFVLDAVTAPLKVFVSTISTHILSALTFPISRQGVVLYIAQYELLVEDACSGMNSLIGLSAISLFYIYIMRRSSWAYSLLLTALVIPIAILANIVRIMTLVLITYFFGDAVAQSFIHGAAGVLLFGVALLLVFVATAASQGSAAQGWNLLVASTMAAFGVAALALRVLRLASPSPKVTSPA
jgi:exosortase B